MQTAAMAFITPMNPALLIPLAAICMPFIFVLLIVWMVLNKESNKKSSGEREEESRAVQEMAVVLEKMEKRIESLETLLLEKHR